MKTFDTPVALIFFNRPDTFGQVFDVIRKIRPTHLFLIQDGARNEKDVENIRLCRQIAENIDWECDVKKNYSEVNLGCGQRPCSGISWAFQYTDRLMILEDDCVADESFFPYCEELLERYKDDQRIAYISGLNHFETWDCGKDSYFFAKTGAIGGWATWRWAWEANDYFASAVNDARATDLLKYEIGNKLAYESLIRALKRANASAENGEKLSYWDIQFSCVKNFNHRLVIVPTVNLIRNIGIGDTSTHGTAESLNTFKRFKNFVLIPTHSLTVPLKHPTYMLCDRKYDSAVYRVRNNTFCKKMKLRFENLFSKLFYGKKRK